MRRWNGLTIVPLDQRREPTTGASTMTLGPGPGIFVLLATAAVLTSCASSRLRPPPLVGAWEFAPPEGSSQRGLLIFTDTHYSMMFGRGPVDRSTYSADRRMNDEETVTAYNSITANSGTYAVNGERVTITAVVANDPNYMAAWPNNGDTLTLRVEGDRLTWVNPGYIGLEATMTLRRVE
ncbi:MAG: lipocalin-like domain-containing protein [Gemmatimonadales bacterium]